jgi:hypothetical protein
MWTRVRQASERLPNRARAVSILVLPLLAFATNASVGTAAVRPLSVAFVALSLFTLWAHLPVLLFDGPLPFSARGVHRSDRIYPWEHVTAVEPGEGRDLVAVLDDGERVRLRVRGARTHEQYRDLVARYKPEAIRF